MCCRRRESKRVFYVLQVTGTSGIALSERYICLLDFREIVCSRITQRSIFSCQYLTTGLSYELKNAYYLGNVTTSCNMSSRLVRRLQGKDPLEKPDQEFSDNEHTTDCGVGAKRKVLSKNSFGLLSNGRESSDEKEQEVDKTELISDLGDTLVSGCKKKKKKKKKKPRERKPKFNYVIQHDNSEDELMDLCRLPEDAGVAEDSYSDYHISRNSSLLHISVNNLNINYELKKIFGSGIIENNLRRKARGKPTKSFRLVNPKENWPPVYKTGISMKMEKDGNLCKFTFIHSHDYQNIQRKFLEAVESLNPDNIIAILNTHPYHIDALIQLSDLCKLSEDLQVAAELNERALYCLENAFHHQFNMARGNCRLDYRYQVNRPFFISLFKHLIFVGEKACYKTALELCKLLLLLDFEMDPLGVVLCIDFYALRSRNYKWLIQAASEWETKKSLSQLPNFAFSTALAHFYIAETGESNNMSQADGLLQDALILFPGVLKPLLDKCNIQCEDTVFQHPFFSTESYRSQSNALQVLISLYVNRTYHEWKSREVLNWLEKNVRIVLQRVDSLDPFVEQCAKQRISRYTGSPKNMLRHIILSDMKDVTSIVNDINGSFMTFDPLPPLDSIDIYHRQNVASITELSPSLSLFFRSILPSFNLNSQGNGYIANNAIADNRVNEQAQRQTPFLQETLQHSVTMLMDAVALLLTNVHAQAEAEDEIAHRNGNDQSIIDNAMGEISNQHISNVDNPRSSITDSSSDNDDQPGSQ